MEFGATYVVFGAFEALLMRKLEDRLFEGKKRESDIEIDKEVKTQEHQRLKRRNRGQGRCPRINPRAPTMPADRTASKTGTRITSRCHRAGNQCDATASAFVTDAIPCVSMASRRDAGCVPMASVSNRCHRLRTAPIGPERDEIFYSFCHYFIQFILGYFEILALRGRFLESLILF